MHACGVHPPCFPETEPADVIREVGQDRQVKSAFRLFMGTRRGRRTLKNTNEKMIRKLWKVFFFCSARLNLAFFSSFFGGYSNFLYTELSFCICIFYVVRLRLLGAANRLQSFFAISRNQSNANRWNMIHS